MPHNPNPQPNPWDELSADMIGMDAFIEDQRTVVEEISLDLIRPDPWQPRRTFPEDLRRRIAADEITPRQAIREFVQSVRIIARKYGRPFNNPFELLLDTDPVEVPEDPEPRTPQEERLYQLLVLARSMDTEGQINPVTVIEKTRGHTPRFQIETGERRFLAALIRREFDEAYSSTGKILCIIVPPDKTSPLRQARENTNRQSLNAIGMARQIALLLMFANDLPVPDDHIDDTFYKQAYDLNLRGHSDLIEPIFAALGGISQTQFARYKALLQLSAEAMQLADQHNLSERKIRPILSRPPDEHSDFIQKVIEFDLNANEVEELCQMEFTEDQEVVSDTKDTPMRRRARKFARTIVSSNDLDTDILWQAMLEADKGNEFIATARIEELISKLEILVKWGKKGN